MLRNKSMFLKLETIIVFTLYLLAILRHNTLLTRRTWVFAGCVALRVSYSQWAALRLYYSQRAALRVWMGTATVGSGWQQYLLKAAFNDWQQKWPATRETTAAMDDCGCWHLMVAIENGNVGHNKQWRRQCLVEAVIANGEAAAEYCRNWVKVMMGGGGRGERGRQQWW
jgi:hypothetical protein